MKTGQQVYLAFSPESKGTVSAVEKDRIRVTWPKRWAMIDKDKTVLLGRERVWYDKSVVRFLIPVGA